MVCYQGMSLSRWCNCNSNQLINWAHANWLIESLRLLSSHQKIGVATTKLASTISTPQQALVSPSNITTCTVFCLWPTYFFTWNWSGATRVYKCNVWPCLPSIWISFTGSAVFTFKVQGNVWQWRIIPRCVSGMVTIWQRKERMALVRFVIT